MNSDPIMPPPPPARPARAPKTKKAPTTLINLHSILALQGVPESKPRLLLVDARAWVETYADPIHENPESVNYWCADRNPYYTGWSEGGQIIRALHGPTLEDALRDKYASCIDAHERARLLYTVFPPHFIDPAWLRAGEFNCGTVHEALVRLWAETPSPVSHRKP